MGILIPLSFLVIWIATIKYCVRRSEIIEVRQKEEEYKEG